METVERYRPWIILGASVIALLIIAFVVAATISSWWPVVVDIVLVITALLSLIMLGVLTYATITLIRTIQGTRDEIMPVLESLKDTTSAVQATAKAASAFGVAPSVRTASFVVGAGEIASTILGRGRPRKRAEKRQQRRQEIEREMAAGGTSDDTR